MATPADDRPAARSHGAGRAGEVKKSVFTYTWSSPPSGSQLGAQKAALSGRGSEVGAAALWVPPLPAPRRRQGPGSAAAAREPAHWGPSAWSGPWLGCSEDGGARRRCHILEGTA